ncbi:type II toxin-antitoxin system VapB family antitoxin [Kitasatospora sp. NPDC093558]|uniref:type II toxin-antitoxin system VapB family antitoxin n=1 Tax=Kitasatospora sp. NPDC093558 TaxID=3155201 RepID=UPI00342A5CCB
MAKTTVDVDDEILAEAMRLMGTTTKKETINNALADYVSRMKRLEAPARPSAEDHGSCRETSYLLRSPANAQGLMEAVARDRANLAHASKSYSRT